MRLLTFAFLTVCCLVGKTQPSDKYKPIVLDVAYEHTKWTTTPADIIYEFAAFTSSFDSDDDNDGDGKGEAWGIPEWVAYEIKGTPNQTKSGDRPSKWLSDANRSSIVPTDATYHVSGTNKMTEVKGDYRFVRGHLCMKIIASRVSLDAEYNTHTTLNAVPQLQWQNAGVWLGLEKQSIKWAEKHKRVWVVTGPVFFGKSPALWLGQKNEVKAAVPDALYKIVIKEKNGKPEALAFLFPNIQPSEIEDEEYAQFLTSVDKIERLTGLEFMQGVSGLQNMKKANEGKSVSDQKSFVENW